jgi:excisionase family DNA binding protein
MREDNKARTKHGRPVDEAAKKAGAFRSSIHRLKRPAAEASDEDDLIRLIRIIARQAAQEAFSVFRDAFDVDAIKPPPLLDPPNLEPAREGHAGKECAPPEPGERFLSVAEVAKRLGVAEKTVRRKIASGDLPASSRQAHSGRRARAYSLSHPGASPKGMSKAMIDRSVQYLLCNSQIVIVYA